MRTFIFVLSLGIVAIYNIGGFVGVIAWLLGLSAWGSLCGFIWYYNHTTNTVNDNDGLIHGDEVNTHNTDPTNADTDDDGNDQPLLLALIAIVDPCTTAQGAVNYSVCSSPYGRCTTTPGETAELEVAQPKFLPIRRGRMSHMGNEERRASRGKADNSWKRHRSTQWR